MEALKKQKSLQMILLK